VEVVAINRTLVVVGFCSFVRLRIGGLATMDDSTDCRKPSVTGTEAITWKKSRYCIHNRRRHKRKKEPHGRSHDEEEESFEGSIDRSAIDRTTERSH